MGEGKGEVGRRKKKGKNKKNERTILPLLLQWRGGQLDAPALIASV